MTSPRSRALKEAFGQHPKPATRVVPAKSKPPAFNIGNFLYHKGWNGPSAKPRPSVLRPTLAEAVAKGLIPKPNLD